MRFLLAFLFSLVLIGCGGYEPTVKYSKSIFKEPVLVHVKIDPEDPDTGEYLQDEITKMATNRLNLSTTKNVNKAKNYIIVNVYTINTTPTNKDDKGNVIRYSINAAIKFATQDRYGFWSKNIVSSEYVPVKAKSSISESAKEKAAKVAIKKALDEYVYAVIKRGQKMEKEKAKEKSEENTQNNSSLTETQNTPAIESVESVSSADEQNSSGINIQVVDNQEKPIQLVVPNENNTPVEVSGY